MKALVPPVETHPDAIQGPRVRPLERRRGQWGMWLFIGTEGMLFAMLLFSYFYLGASRPEWPPGEDPSYRLALYLLGILLASSVTLHWGEKGIKEGSQLRLRAGLALTLLLGVAFLVVQTVEYRNHLETLTPTESAYGSIFYTITSFHLAHLLVGFFMLVYLLVRALAGHFDQERHLAVGNVSLYWHFVDVVWVSIVLVLYLSPHWY